MNMDLAKPVTLVVLLTGLVFLLGTGYLLIWSRSNFSRALPKSARPSNKTSRIAEALILFCAAAAILVFAATNISTGGRLLRLDQYRPGFAAINVAVAAAAAAGVLLGVLVTLLRRTSGGTMIAAAALCWYGLMVNGPEKLIESLGPKEWTIPDATLTFEMTGIDAQGAELWVNGVKLGTLPHKTTFDEFYAAVPFWAEEPNEFKLENRDSWLRVPSYERPGEGGSSNFIPWARIEIPKQPVHWRDRRAGRISDRDKGRQAAEARTYYVRVRLGDEWGYASGRSGRSGGGGGRYERRRASVRFGFIFPERQKQIEKLLDIARLHGYAPQPQWFEAMETYRSDGWVAVREAMDTEPDMSKLLDAWATWRYELDGITDPTSAWRKFEQICKQAERRQYYMTSDIAGRAVELLVPRLDQKRLIRRARKAIRSTRFYSWHNWQMNDRLQFGMSYNRDATRFFGAWTGDRGGQLSPGGYAVAHAVWRLDEILDSQDDTKPNVVESELVPAFVAAYPRGQRHLRMAAAIGGPHIEQYLLRQNWRASPEELPMGQVMSVTAEDVNNWLYLLANLQSPTGRRFRHDNQERLMQMADAFTADISSRWNDELDFLFLDKELGDKSLAMKYWPRFKTLPGRADRDALSFQFQYLIRMEPLSSVEMYAQCWRDFRGDSYVFDRALKSFTKLPVERSKRERIRAALKEQIEKTVTNVTDGLDEHETRRRLLARLGQYLLEPEDHERAEEVIADLMAGGSRYKTEDITNWLANARPQNPLLNMLAAADEPELRLLAIAGLKEHPTPANRQTLQEFLQDGDEQVCSAAQSVATELDEMMQMPVQALAYEEKGD
ncbi:MAG: HEAT repeat domain-containing protein [Planctomycetota bacterium]|jgi:hypothetical protein